MNTPEDRTEGRAPYPYRQHDTILLEAHRAIYFPIPKIASSSLKLVFAEGLRLAPLVPGKPRVNPHARDFPYVPRETLATQYADYFKFAIVRNPFSRLLSCYRNKIRTDIDDRPNFVGGVHKEFLKFGRDPGLRRYGRFRRDMGFDEFIEVVSGIPDEHADRHFRAQCAYLCAPDGSLLPDYLGKFERLGEELEYIFRRIGLEPKALPRLVDSGTGNQYREQFTEHGRRLVCKRYGRDLELLGYEF